MPANELIEPTPWDTAALGVPTWHVRQYTEEALAAAAATPGHHTLKVDPLADKALLARYGFYYCDTLIEPWCTAQRLRAQRDEGAGAAVCRDADEIVPLCADAFLHGRFHRDFQVARAGAEQRYAQWARQLCSAGQVFVLTWQGARAGFIAAQGPLLALHAVAPAFRGKGLARYWWSDVCLRLLSEERSEIRSSISAANMGAVNLYASLGFAFRKPCDVYHCVVS